jgi:hypothetical protein
MPGHPRLGGATKKEKKDVDARRKAGHDGVERAWREKFILDCNAASIQSPL